MIGESPGGGGGGGKRGKEGGKSPLHTQIFPAIPDHYEMECDHYILP